MKEALLGFGPKKMITQQMFSNHVQIWRCKLRPWQHSVGSLGNAICFLHCLHLYSYLWLNIVSYLPFVAWLISRVADMARTTGTCISLDSNFSWLLELMVKHNITIVILYKLNIQSHTICFFSRKTSCFYDCKREKLLNNNNINFIMIA